jgi:hypothetical protein
VGDHRAAVAGAVDGGGVLDRVQGGPHAGVADGVHVELEPVGVERGRRLGQLLLGPVRDTTGVWRVQVGLQQGGRAGLDHPVGEQLDRARPDRGGRRGDGGGRLGAGPQLPEGAAALPPGVAGGDQGGPDPAGQLAGGGGVQVAGQDRRVDHGVLGPDDAGGGQLPQAVAQGLRPLSGVKGWRQRGDQVGRALEQGAERAAVATAQQPPPRRVGGGRVDAGGGQGGRVGPHGVVVGGPQEHRAVGHHPVQPGGVEAAAGGEGRVVATAGDHRPLGMLPGPAAEALQQLLQAGGAADRRAEQELAPAQRVDVPVPEPGDQAPTGEVDHLAGLPGPGPRGLADGDHPAAVDRDRVGPRPPRVAGQHRPAQEHQPAAHPATPQWSRARTARARAVVRTSARGTDSSGPWASRASPGP